jgi:uncharacterized protein YgiM (DUF1202 family)
VAEAFLKAGATDGGNLDGGGSSQWYSPNGSFYTGRQVRGYIAIWLNKTDTSVVKPVPDIRTVVVKTSLNIREFTTTSSKVVGSLHNGEKVVVLETKGVWCRINRGWVSSAYLRKDK